MDRRTQIIERFTAHFTAIGAQPLVVPADEWADVGDQHNLRVQLGFRRPVASDLVARFCPDLVVAQTEHLSDRDFTAYLDAMQFVLDSEATLGPLVELDDATAVVDQALAERAPGSLRLLTEVQMAWIDRQSRAR